METITVLDQQVAIAPVGGIDYISITDMARYRDEERTDYIVQNWLRNRDTIEFLGIWEHLNNPTFDGAAFDVPAAGRGVSFSPNGERIVWQEGGGPGNAAGGPPADPSNRIFVAAVDGTAAREVTRLANGSLSGWLDDTTLLVRVREGRDSDIDQLRTHRVYLADFRRRVRAGTQLV